MTTLVYVSTFAKPAANPLEEIIPSGVVPTPWRRGWTESDCPRPFAGRGIYEATVVDDRLVSLDRLVVNTTPVIMLAVRAHQETECMKSLLWFANEVSWRMSFRHYLATALKLEAPSGDFESLKALRAGAFSSSVAFWDAAKEEFLTLYAGQHTRDSERVCWPAERNRALHRWSVNVRGKRGADDRSTKFEVATVWDVTGWEVEAFARAEGIAVENVWIDIPDDPLGPSAESADGWRAAMPSRRTAMDGPFRYWKPSRWEEFRAELAARKRE